MQTNGFCDALASVRDLGFVYAVEARKTKFFVGYGFEIGAPFMVDEFVKNAVGGFFGAIAVDQTAVIDIFSAQCGIVGKIPPNDRLTMLAAEPKFVEPFDDFGLRFFIFSN